MLETVVGFGAGAELVAGAGAGAELGGASVGDGDALFEADPEPDEPDEPEPAEGAGLEAREEPEPAAGAVAGCPARVAGWTPAPVRRPFLW